MEKVTCYDFATLGSGTVVSEIVREFNDMGMIVKEYQEHGGAKSGSTLYVGINYDTSASSGEFTKGLRQTSVRYPNGRLVHQTYGSSGSSDDNLNRLLAIKDDSSGSPGASLAEYTYLGLGQVVIQDLPQPDVKLDYFGGTSGAYAGLDRFGRVNDQRWYSYGTSQDVDRIKYGHDRASNRIWRENLVSKSLGTPVYQDEFYTYDGLHRLKTFDRGQINGSYTGITGTAAQEEDWTLDPLGNWSSFVQKTSGTTDLSQSRSVNQTNEITDISETTGSSWITPAYDRSGNMTTLPDSGNPTTSLTATYDAWNRLVTIADSSSTLATYAYDGLYRRIHATSSSVTRHFYHTINWQTLEERLGTSSLTDRQYLWGPLYIDHLLCRDRDTSSTPDGTLDERLYSLQDANWNVTSIVDSSGAVQERIGYAPYGHIQFLDASFGVRTNSSFDIRTTYTGREWIPEVSLYYFRNRWYHAGLGSFISRDPIGARARSLSDYNYVGNRPLYLRDPSGLKDIGYFFDGAGQRFNRYGTTILYWLFQEYGTVGDVSIYQELPLNFVGDARSFEVVVANAHNRICEEFCREAEKIDCCSATPPPPPFNIDLFGWSRGAIAALTVARKLNTEGCKCKLVGCGFGKMPITHTAHIKPIDVRFLGLLDPVTLGLGLADYATEVSPNVKSVFWAVADEWSFFTLGQVLPPHGLQIVKHYKIMHDQIGFTGVLTVDADLKSAAEAAGVKFRVP